MYFKELTSKWHMHSLVGFDSDTQATTVCFPSAASDVNACGGNGVTADVYEDCSIPGTQTKCLITVTFEICPNFS